MIAFRGADEERRVAELAALLGLDKSEVLRRAVNHFYALHQQEFQAFEWLAPRLDDLPGSGRADVAAGRQAELESLYGERSRHRR